MGVPVFYTNCRRQGVDVTKEECVELRAAWLATYPELNWYLNPAQDGKTHKDVFKRAKQESADASGLDEDMVDTDVAESTDDSDFVQLYCAYNTQGMRKAKSSYSAACNYPFQSLASCVSKRALWLVFLDSQENDYKIVDFIHDELLIEVDVNRIDEVGRRVEKLMVQAANDIMPDMFIRAEPAAMLRWTKDAEPAFDENGKLIPWTEPEEKGAVAV